MGAMNRLSLVLAAALLGLVVLGCGNPAPKPQPSPTGVTGHQDVQKHAAGSPASESKQATPPKESERLEELRVPQEPNLASNVLTKVALAIVLEEENAKRAPRFESERVERGLRVTCNDRGSRHSYVLPGKEIEQGKPPYSAWLVDGRLVLVTSNPLRPDEKLDEDRLFREPRADFAKRGWRVVPESQQTLKFPGGERAEYWEAVPPKDGDPQLGDQVAKYQVGVTVVRRHIILFTAVVRKGENECASADLVRQTMLSLQRLPDLAENKVPLSLEDLLKKGLTLAQGLSLRDKLIEKRHGAFLNKVMASRQDLRLERGLPLLPKDFLHHVRFHLLAGQGELDLASDDDLRRLGRDPAYRHQFLHGDQALTVTVFDGASAHTVNLLQYDRKLGGFVYWEPWAKGTFLGAENNRAGVSARQHSSHSKHFWIIEKEMEKVLYSAAGEWEALQRDHALLELLDQPEKQALAEIKKLQDQGDSQVALPRLLAAGQACLLDKRPNSAAIAFLAGHARAPQSAEALVGLAEARRLQGDKPAAERLYLEASDLLRRDKELTPPKKSYLEEQIRQGRIGKLR